MSVEKAKEFLLALKEKGADEAWAAKAAEAKSGEERYALMADMAKDMGYDLTADDIKEALAGLKKDGGGLEALDDDAVENVAGGLWVEDVARTRFIKCGECGEYCFTYTGVYRKAFWIFCEYQYQCDNCGAFIWI